MRTIRLFSMILAAMAIGAAAGPGKPRLAASDSGGIGSPVLGYLSHGATVRPVLGIPGASRLGDPLVLTDAVVRVHVSPGHRFALADLAEGGVALLDLDAALGGAVALRPIASAQVAEVIFSPSGRAALLYIRDSGRLQVVTGLPDSPEVFREISLENAAQLAISDDGEAVLAAVEGKVSLVAADGTAQPVYAGESVSALAFAPAGRNALITDATANRVVLVEDGAARTLSDGTIEAPASVLAQGQEAWVASPSTNKLWRIDLVSGEAQFLDTATAPDQLQILQLPGSFLFAATPGEPAWLVAGEKSAQRVYFVPAGRE